MNILLQFQELHYKFLDYYYVCNNYPQIKIDNERIIKENRDLLYKLDGVKLAKDEIYENYQLLILKKI